MRDVIPQLYHAERVAAERCADDVEEDGRRVVQAHLHAHFAVLRPQQRSAGSGAGPFSPRTPALERIRVWRAAAHRARMCHHRADDGATLRHCRRCVRTAFRAESSRLAAHDMCVPAWVLIITIRVVRLAVRALIITKMVLRLAVRALRLATIGRRMERLRRACLKLRARQKSTLAESSRLQPQTTPQRAAAAERAAACASHTAIQPYSIQRAFRARHNAPHAAK